MASLREVTTAGVAHLRAAQGQDVVQQRAGDLGRIQQLELREVNRHLRRRLSARYHLELHRHTVDGACLAGLADRIGRRNQGRPSRGVDLPRPVIDLAQHAPLQVGAYWKMMRRDMAVPAKTFSLVAASIKPSGANTTTRPAATSSWEVTPLTPW